jgi:hypothetical protein
MWARKWTDQYLNDPEQKFDKASASEILQEC